MPYHVSKLRLLLARLRRVAGFGVGALRPTTCPLGLPLAIAGFIGRPFAAADDILSCGVVSAPRSADMSFKALKIVERDVREISPPSLRS